MARITYAIIALGMLVMMLYLFPGLATVFDAMQESENMTWGVATNVTAGYTSANAMATLSPTSDGIARAWKYIVLVAIVGGLLYITFSALKGKSNE